MKKITVTLSFSPECTEYVAIPKNGGATVTGTSSFDLAVETGSGRYLAALNTTKTESGRAVSQEQTPTTSHHESVNRLYEAYLGLPLPTQTDIQQAARQALLFVTDCIPALARRQNHELLGPLMMLAESDQTMWLKFLKRYHDLDLSKYIHDEKITFRRGIIVVPTVRTNRHNYDLDLPHMATGDGTTFYKFGTRETGNGVAIRLASLRLPDEQEIIALFTKMYLEGHYTLGCGFTQFN